MKSFKFFRIPMLLAGIVFLASVFLMSCKPCDDDDDENGGDTLLRKPNIYIYPTETTDLEVLLSFPQGGDIVSSIPEYGLGWNITVDPDGTIDDTYDFLFYESVQPDLWQYAFGWIKESADLEIFFRGNLKENGFAGREIDDFLAYWLPLLDDHAWYCIYPQNKLLIDKIVGLSFSVKPDNIQRLFYVIKGYDKLPDIPVSEPAVAHDFKREGFYVLEWGGVLK